MAQLWLPQVCWEKSLLCSNVYTGKKGSQGLPLWTPGPLLDMAFIITLWSTRRLVGEGLNVGWLLEGHCVGEEWSTGQRESNGDWLWADSTEVGGAVIWHQWTHPGPLAADELWTRWNLHGCFWTVTQDWNTHRLKAGVQVADYTVMMENFG